MVRLKRDTGPGWTARRSAESKVTLLVPTKNHSDLLIRLLKYYSSTNFQGYICIGDSSDDGHLHATREVIQKLQGGLNIVHREYPGLNISACMTELASLVTTEYVAALMDDDFLVPRSLGQCALFLEGHPGYSAAYGMAILFGLNSHGAYGDFVWADRYLQRPIEGETGAERLLDHLSNYSVTLFSVHRVESWLGMWKNASRAPARPISEELLPGCLSVIPGKIKELGCLYLLRQIHNRRALHHDIFDELTSSAWSSSYEIFRDCLAGALAQQDAISLDEARAVVRKAFWSYLAKGLNHKWQARYGHDSRPRVGKLREIVRRIPGARRGWRTIRSALGSNNDAFSLEKLLEPSSPYHSDFMPIYRAITTPPAGLNETE